MRHVLVLSLLSVAACSPPVPFDPNLCPPPTGEQCANHEAMGGCDRYFIDQAKTDPEAACSLLYKQGFSEEVERWPQKTVLATTLYNGIQKFPPDSGVKEDVAQVPNTNSFEPTGADSLLFGELMKNANATRINTSVAAMVLRNNLITKRKEWRDNGKVTSCREYVHEKYFDYTSYLDQVIINGGFTDPRLAYDIAYTVDPINNPSYAIGTRHLTNPIIKSWNFDDSGVQVVFPKNQPKNDFLLVPPPAASRIQFIKAAPGANDEIVPSAFVNGPVIIRLKNLNRTALSFAGVAFDDVGLKNTVVAAQAVRHDESFEWHRQMGQRNAGILDEQLYLYDAKKAEFLKLLERREMVQDELATALSGGAQVPSAGISKFATKWYLDPIWNPPNELVSNAAKRGLNVLNGLSNHPGSALSTPIFTVSNNPQQPGPQPVDRVTAIPQVMSACGLQDGKQKSGVNKAICLSYQLAALDYLIEAELKKAQNDNCLAIGGANVTAPCDWSPATFARAISRLFQEEREAAFNLCMASVEGDNFSYLENREFIYTAADGSSINEPARNYAQDTTWVTRFFKKQDEYLTVVAKDVGPLLDRTGAHKLRLWKSVGDKYSMGNDFFGASMEYSAGFAMEDVAMQAQNCDIRTSTWGLFGIDLKAIGATIELINASVQATVGGDSAIGPAANKNRFDAELRVLGYKWGVHEEIPEAQTATYSEQKMQSQQFIEQFAFIQISWVTVRIGAAISGVMGYGFEFNAGKKTVMGDPCTVTRVGVSGKIVPFAMIQGSAYAAIEAVVARAGIKGYITLVSVSTPFGGVLSIGSRSDDPNIIDATFRLGASLRLEFFSGRIVAYIEVGICPLCWSAEGEIVSWRGLVFDIPLFDFNLSLVLGDLSRILNQQGSVPSEKPPAPMAPVSP